MVVLFCFLCYFCFVPLLFLFCSFVVVAVCLLFASAYHVVRLRVAVCRDCPTEDGGEGGGDIFLQVSIWSVMYLMVSCTGCHVITVFCNFF